MPLTPVFQTSRVGRPARVLYIADLLNKFLFFLLCTETTIHTVCCGHSCSLKFLIQLFPVFGVLGGLGTYSLLSLYN